MEIHNWQMAQILIFNHKVARSGSKDLIEALLQKKISVIGVDFAGIRRGKEHTPMDQHCANHEVFIVENLCNLHNVLKNGCTFVAHIYPMNYAEMTGLPCRVVVDI